LQQVKAFHANALRATEKAQEKDALSRVEFCAERTFAAAQKTCTALQAFATEVEECKDRTEARIRKLQLSRVTALFQDALTTYHHVQQSFRSEMEKKVSRQLKVAFPGADENAIAAVTAGQQSAASAIQDTICLQSGADSKLSITLALQATQDKCDELERLARAAKELRQRFVDVEAAVLAQGEVVDDICQHVESTRMQTEAVCDQLETVRRRRAKCRWRSFMSVLLLVVGLIVILILKLTSVI